VEATPTIDELAIYSAWTEAPIGVRAPEARSSMAMNNPIIHHKTPNATPIRWPTDDHEAGKLRNASPLAAAIARGHLRPRATGDVAAPEGPHWRGVGAHAILC
jgi:hypothetical protein